MSFQPSARPPMCSKVHSRAVALVVFGLALAPALGGCANHSEPPVAKGKIRPLNPGRWTPGPADLKDQSASLASPSPSAHSAR